MELIDHEVYYDYYCPRCIYEKIEMWDDPCENCLKNPMQPHSHKPLEYRAKAGHENDLAPQFWSADPARIEGWHQKKKGRSSR